jgi:hypothetical protein
LQVSNLRDASSREAAVLHSARPAMLYLS